MEILLLDVDSTIPNLALMKLSSFHKEKGDSVSLIRIKEPYYPTRKKKKWSNFENNFDRIYASSIFIGNKENVEGKDIIWGGTGVSLDKTLPDEIENLDPDYSVYPDNDTSYGFISRGCIRKCSFCFVPRKEGMIRQVNKISNIIKHKKVKFLDNNILALPNHISILKELVSLGVRCQFNQGLDIRLVNKENSFLLSQLNYIPEYIFAFDSWSYLPVITKKIKLLNWRSPFQLKFFVYCHPLMEISSIVKRIEWLRKEECLPYIMRDISCWNSSYNFFYIDIAAYCNQPNLFKKMTFSEFLNKRHTKTERIQNSLSLYEKNK